MRSLISLLVVAARPYTNTHTSEPQHGAERDLSTEVSAKTFDTEERDGDDLMDGNLAMSIQLGWGECRTPPPPASRSTHARA